MSIRKITSLTALITFLLTLLTSIVLYIMPHGRVCYWANWHFLWLEKKEWDALHINLGILFLLSIVVHIFYNYKSITAYLKNKRKELKVFTKEFITALALSLICIIGTYREIPPFSTVLEFSEQLKEEGERKYGRPPYGHAELSSLQSFARRMQLDADKALQLLQERGYIANNTKQSLLSIAKQNGVSPQDIYTIIQEAGREKREGDGSRFSNSLRYGMGKGVGEGKCRKKGSFFPDSPPAGTGKMLLSDFCKKYKLNTAIIISSLQEKGIAAEEGVSMKNIAHKNNIKPAELYSMIESIAAQRAKQ